MGLIKYNKGRDFIVESENNKIYKIDEEQLLELEQYLNDYSFDIYYSGDDKFKNKFIELLDFLNNTNCNLLFKDKDYGIDNIKFKFITYIGEEMIDITLTFLEEMFKKRMFDENILNIYMYDEIKNLSFHIGEFKFRLDPGNSSFFGGYASGLKVYGKTYFDRFKFIDFICFNYFGMIYDDGNKENFDWE